MTARFGIGSERREHAQDLVAVEPHHGEDRPELDHHREHAARIVVAEHPCADEQVRSRRHRQELGDALDDAENRGFDEWIHQTQNLKLKTQNLKPRGKR